MLAIYNNRDVHLSYYKTTVGKETFQEISLLTNWNKKSPKALGAKSCTLSESLADVVQLCAQWCWGTEQLLSSHKTVDVLLPPPVSSGCHSDAQCTGSRWWSSGSRNPSRIIAFHERLVKIQTQSAINIISLAEHNIWQSSGGQVKVNFHVKVSTYWYIIHGLSWYYSSNNACYLWNIQLIL